MVAFNAISSTLCAVFKLVEGRRNDSPALYFDGVPRVVETAFRDAADEAASGRLQSRCGSELPERAVWPLPPRPLVLPWPLDSPWPIRLRAMFCAGTGFEIV
jgi:hypothetical protein